MKDTRMALVAAVTLVSSFLAMQTSPQFQVAARDPPPADAGDYVPSQRRDPIRFASHILKLDVTTAEESEVRRRYRELAKGVRNPLKSHEQSSSYAHDLNKAFFIFYDNAKPRQMLQESSKVREQRQSYRQWWLKNVEKTCEAQEGAVRPMVVPADGSSGAKASAVFHNLVVDSAQGIFKKMMQQAESTATDFLMVKPEAMDLFQRRALPAYRALEAEAEAYVSVLKTWPRDPEDALEILGLGMKRTLDELDERRVEAYEKSAARSARESWKHPQHRGGSGTPPELRVHAAAGLVKDYVQEQRQGYEAEAAEAF